MSNSIDIRPDQRKVIDYVLQRYAPRPSQVFAFGSRARWTAKAHSDLDIALDAGRKLTLGEVAALEAGFEESPLPWKVDIVDLHGVSEAFRKVVEGQAVLLSEIPISNHQTSSTKRLGDVVELKRGYDLPQLQRRPGQFPIISSSGVSGYHNEAMAKSPGVVTGRYGTIGHVFYTENDYWPLNTALYVRDFKDNNPKFIYYLLKTLDWNMFNDKSGVPGVNRNHVHEAVVRLPELSEQRAVALVFSALDDKIELCRRINETLEEMAEAIFRDWFVDFGPVHRKLAGMIDPVEIMGGVTPDPDRAEGLARLFPNELAPMLPKGWVPRTVGSVARRIATGPFGSRIKKDNFVSAGVPVIRGMNLAHGFVDDDFVFLTHDKARELMGSRAEREDIVFTHRGTLGQLGRIHPSSNYETYIASQSQIVLGIEPSKTSPLFMYWFLKSDAGLNAWLSNAGGAGVPSIARPTDSLKRIEFLDPGPELAFEFDRFVRTLEARAMALGNEAAILAETRDYLLPRLMSGEVRVGDLPQEIAA